MISSIRLDRIFREVKDLVPFEGIELLTPSTVHGVVPQSSLDSRPQQAYREGYQVAPAQRNDFVISLSSHAHGIEWCGLTGGVSPDYTLLRPIVDKEYCRYLRYALKSQYIIGQLGIFKTGVRMGLRLTWNKVRYCQIDLPRLPEATRLADYLDRETARIDALIAKKTRFIELLAEKRQGLITHAVSKGLNPNATIKDSHMAWLGTIPSHWSLRRVKTVSAFTTSGPRGWSEKVSERGPLFIQSGDLKDNLGVDFSNAQRVSIGNDAEAQRTKLKDGDVLVCITGARTGNVALCKSVPEPAHINQHLCLIRPTREVLPSFLSAALKSNVGQVQFELAQYGLKQGLGLEGVREVFLALPPMDEQKAIVAHIDAASLRVDTLTTKTERSIELLREHRTALITAAVTGNIDLRAVA